MACSMDGSGPDSDSCYRACTGSFRVVLLCTVCRWSYVHIPYPLCRAPLVRSDAGPWILVSPPHTVVVCLWLAYSSAPCCSELEAPPLCDQPPCLSTPQALCILCDTMLLLGSLSLHSTVRPPCTDFNCFLAGGPTVPGATFWPASCNCTEEKEAVLRVVGAACCWCMEGPAVSVFGPCQTVSSSPAHTDLH